MDQYGLIGWPVSHSFSKDYFDIKFRMEGIEAEYKLFPMENIQDVKELILENKALKGLQITIPHKVAIIDLLDELDTEAKKIGSVNTIKIDRKDGELKLKGYNTDASGFENALVDFLPGMSYKALVLGSGGSSKAVCYTLEKLGIDYTIVSRTPEKHMISYQDIDKAILEERKLIINTSPLGMHPEVNACPEIPYHQLGPEHHLFDLIYNPEETLFLEKGHKQGAKVENGLKMFYGQAEAAWGIIRN